MSEGLDWEMLADAFESLFKLSPSHAVIKVQEFLTMALVDSSSPSAALALPQLPITTTTTTATTTATTTTTTTTATTATTTAIVTKHMPSSGLKGLLPIWEQWGRKKAVVKVAMSVLARLYASEAAQTFSLFFYSESLEKVVAILRNITLFILLSDGLSDELRVFSLKELVRALKLRVHNQEHLEEALNGILKVCYYPVVGLDLADTVSSSILKGHHEKDGPLLPECIIDILLSMDDPNQPQTLLALCSLGPYSDEAFYNLYKIIRTVCDEHVHLAVAAFSLLASSQIDRLDGRSASLETICERLSRHRPSYDYDYKRDGRAYLTTALAAFDRRRVRINRPGQDEEQLDLVSYVITPVSISVMNTATLENVVDYEPAPALVLAHHACTKGLTRLSQLEVDAFPGIFNLSLLRFGRVIRAGCSSKSSHPLAILHIPSASDSGDPTVTTTTIPHSSNSSETSRVFLSWQPDFDVAPQDYLLVGPPAFIDAMSDIAVATIRTAHRRPKSRADLDNMVLQLFNQYHAASSDSLSFIMLILVNASPTTTTAGL